LWCFVLQSDTFNENQSPTNDPVYIAALGAIFFEAMNAGDQDAIWLMQALVKFQSSLIKSFLVFCYHALRRH